MLIIRRRRGESIVIGEDIEIEILETTSTQVKLGIRAPKDITVLRSEIRVTRDVNRVSNNAAPDPGRLNDLVESLRENAESAAAPSSKAPSSIPRPTKVE